MRLIVQIAVGVALAGAPASFAGAPPVRDAVSMNELIEKLQGEWIVESTLAQVETRTPAERKGLEIWKAGPGRNALIEEYWSSERQLVGHATIWETSPGAFSVLWCDERGCRLLARPAEWRGGLFVIEDEVSANDGVQALRETFEFVSSARFVQRLYTGPSFDKLTLTDTIGATKRK